MNIQQLLYSKTLDGETIFLQKKKQINIKNINFFTFNGSGYKLKEQNKIKEFK